MSNVYFKINTRWQPASERGNVINVVRNHVGTGSRFTRLCLDIMFSVLKVLAVAIQTRDEVAIQDAIQVSEVQVGSYYRMALGFAQVKSRVSDQLDADRENRPPSDTTLPEMTVDDVEVPAVTGNSIGGFDEDDYSALDELFEPMIVED